ncbi:MAG: YdaU family protein [Methylotenera sp.]|nr:YdaU family protein [Methylotenera sp.]
MNFIDKYHLGDHLRITKRMTLIQEGAYIRLTHEYYSLEKPLPCDIKEIHYLVGANTEEEVDAVNSVLKSLFVLNEDGWHNDACDAVLARYFEGDIERKNKLANEKERKARFLKDRADMFAALREVDIVPAFDTTMQRLRELVEKHVKKPKTGHKSAEKTTSDAEKTTSDAEKTTSDAEKTTSDAEKTTSDALGTATQYPVPSTQYPVPSTQYPVPSTQYPVTSNLNKSSAAAFKAEGESYTQDNQKAAAPPLIDKLISNLGNEPNQVDLNNPTISLADELVRALNDVGIKVRINHPAVAIWVKANASVTVVLEAVSIARQRKPHDEAVPPNYLTPIIKEILRSAAHSPVAIQNEKAEAARKDAERNDKAEQERMRREQVLSVFTEQHGSLKEAILNSVECKFANNSVVLKMLKKDRIRGDLHAFFTKTSPRFIETMRENKIDI